MERLSRTWSHSTDFPDFRWQRICLQCRTHRFDLWVGKIPWRRAWQPTPVFLPGESHGQRNLVGYSLWGHKESGTIERLRLDVFFLPLATQLVSD